jgi:hypothetical protein
MIEAMKQALESLEGAAHGIWSIRGITPKDISESITSLRQAIKEAEKQEGNPIKDGWQLSVADGHSGYGVYAHMDEYPEEGAILLMPIAEKQEPCGRLISDTDDGHRFIPRIEDDWSMLDQDLYTHPPEREWVGLDSADFNDFNPHFKPEEAAKWAENKLKEKIMDEKETENFEESFVIEGITPEFIWYEGEKLISNINNFSWRLKKLLNVMESRHKEHIKMLEDVMAVNKKLKKQLKEKNT